MPVQRKSRTPVRERVSQRGVLAAIASARREELGLLQAEVAELADCSPRFVHAVETGKPTVQLDKLLAVLSVLGLHLEVERGSAPDGVVPGSQLRVVYELGANSTGERP